MVFRDTEFFRDTGGNRFRVSGEHNCPGNARLPQIFDCFNRMRLDLICDHDMPQILFSRADVYDRPGLYIRVIIFFCDQDSQILHQLEVSGSDAAAVHFRNDTFAADLFCIAHTGCLRRQTFPICLFQASADRMGGIALGKCGILQQTVCCGLQVLRRSRTAVFRLCCHILCIF